MFCINLFLHLKIACFDIFTWSLKFDLRIVFYVLLPQYYQALFRDGECFLHVVSLLNSNLHEANVEKLVLNVLQTLTWLLASNDASKVFIFLHLFAVVIMVHNNPLFPPSMSFSNEFSSIQNYIFLFPPFLVFIKYFSGRHQAKQGTSNLTA